MLNRCPYSRGRGAFLQDFELRVVFGLEPVDSVTVTMLMDNVTDAFMPDQGPAHRPPLPIFHGGRRAAAMEGGDVPRVPLADGGFEAFIPNTVGTRFEL
jgi:hypothetical protein